MKEIKGIKDGTLLLALKHLKRVHPELYVLLPKTEILQTSSGKLLTDGIIARIAPIYLTSRKIFQHGKVKDIFKIEPIKNMVQFEIIPKKHIRYLDCEFDSELKFFDLSLNEWIFVETNGHDSDIDIDETDREEHGQEKLVIPDEKKEVPVFDQQPIETTPQPEEIVTSDRGDVTLSSQGKLSDRQTVPPGAVMQRIPEAKNKWSAAFYSFIEGISNPHTKRSYKPALESFFKLMRLRPDKVGPEHIVFFKKHLQEKGNDDATIEPRLTALKMFFNHLIDMKLIEINPVMIKRTRIDPYSRATKISKDMFKDVIAQIDINTVPGIRDKAILTFKYFTGRRITEILSLKKQNLIVADKVYYKYQVLKKRKEVFRTKELPPPVWEAIQYYWTASGRKVEPKDPIFAGRDGQLSYEGIRDNLKKYCKLAGITPKEFHLHSIRHLHAGQMEDNGAKLSDIQDHLDHESKEETLIYTEALKKQDVVDDEFWKKLEL